MSPRSTRAAWDAARVGHPWLPARPTANTHYPVGELVRIGQLLPTRTDTWWAVPAGGATDAPAGEVVRAIRDHALTWIRVRLAVSAS